MRKERPMVDSKLTIMPNEEFRVLWVTYQTKLLKVWKKTSNYYIMVGNQLEFRQIIHDANQQLRKANSARIRTYVIQVEPMRRWNQMSGKQ